MKAVTLKNREFRMIPIELPHEHYCKALGRCRCTPQEVRTVKVDPTTGLKDVTKIPKRVPSTLTLLSREVRKDLPEAVLSVPELQTAIRSGRILAEVREVRQAEAPPKTTKKRKPSKKGKSAKEA